MALAAVAVQGRVAVGIGGALLSSGLLLNNGTCALWIELARDVWLPDEAFRAFASRSVQYNSTDGVVTACCTQGAGVSTAASVT